MVHSVDLQHHHSASDFVVHERLAGNLQVANGTGNAVSENSDTAIAI